MKKIFKITGLVFLVFLLLVMCVPFLFKGQIIQAVKRQINQHITAKVDFEDIDIGIFSSFPDVHLSIKKLCVVSDSSFDNMRLLGIQNLRIDLNIMSVLKGQKYEISEIVIESPEMNALVRKDGKANWDIVKPATDTVGANSTDTTQSSFALALKRLVLNQANISFEDEQSGSAYVLRDLHYDLSGDLSSGLTTLAHQLQIESVSVKQAGVKYLSSAHLSVDAKMQADLIHQKYTLEENVFKVNDLELQLDGYVQKLQDKMDMNLTFRMPQISFKSILSLVPAVYTKDFNKIQAAGLVSFEGWLKGVKDSVRIPSFHFMMKIDNGNFKYPSLPQSVKEMMLKVSVDNPDGVLDHTVIDLSQFHIALASNTIDARARVSTPLSDPLIDLFVKGKIDLGSVKDFVPLPQESKLKGVLETDIQIRGSKSMVDKKQYDRFKAEGILTIQNVLYNTPMLAQAVEVRLISFAFSPKRISLNQLDARVGESDFRANGSVANFLEYLFGKNKNLIGTFELNSEYIHVNQFMSGKPSSASKSGKDSLQKEPMTVIEVPKNIDFTLTTNINKVRYDNMDLRNVRGSLQIKDEKVLMQNLSMDVLKGSIKVGGAYNTQNKKKPTIDLTLHMNHIDIQESAQTFNSIEKINPYIKECFGAMSVDFVMQTLLTDSMTPVLPTLYAKGKINTYGLHLQGEQTSKVANLLKLKELSIEDVGVSFQMKNGRMDLDTFPFNIAGTKARFAASYSLDQTIDATLIEKVPFEMVKDQIITPEVQSILTQAKNNDIPIRLPDNLIAIVGIKGKASKPEYTFSLDKGFLNNLKDDLQKGIETKINKEKERLLNEGKKRLNEEKEKLLDKGKQELKKWLPKF